MTALLDFEWARFGEPFEELGVRRYWRRHDVASCGLSFLPWWVRGCDDSPAIIAAIGAGLRRRWRLGGAVMLVAGALMLMVALGVFLTQGSQIRVTGTGLSEHCHPRPDLATGTGETRCDAAVRYTTRTGRVITTTVSDAFPYEFRHRPGMPPTIQLRYDSNDPGDPFKQSNYMSVGEFLLVLGLGGIAATFGVLWLTRAGRIAENSARRRACSRDDPVPAAAEVQGRCGHRIAMTRPDLSCLLGAPRLALAQHSFGDGREACFAGAPRAVPP